MKKLLSLTLLAVLIISSCKKDNTKEGEEAEVVHKVKMVTSASGDVDRYYYDGSDRIQSIKDEGGSWTDYSYLPGLAEQTEYTPSGATDEVIQYQLNADGLVSVFREIYPLPAGPFQYTFNSSKQLTSVVYMDGSNGNAVIQTAKYFYSGKQLDSIHSLDPSDRILTRELLEYYSDVANTISEQHKGLWFWGVQSPKAIKKHTRLYYNASGALTATRIKNYSYETDAQGRITREIMTSDNGSAADNSYTYHDY